MATGDKQARAKLFADLRAARDFVLFQPEASSKRVRLSGPVEAPVMPPRLADHMKHIVPQRRFQEGTTTFSALLRTTCLVYMMRWVEDRGGRVPNVFPLRNSIVPKYIRLDTTLVIQLLLSKTSGLGAKYKLLKDIIGNKDAVWRSVFHLERKCFAPQESNKRAPEKKKRLARKRELLALPKDLKRVRPEPSAKRAELYVAPTGSSERVVGVDPGKSDLISSGTGPGDWFRYTQKRDETGEKKHRRARTRMARTLVEGKTVVEWELSTFSRKALTVSAAEAWGDWSRGSQMKFLEPTKGVGMRKLFSRAGYEVVLVDEFRTSCTCFGCEGRVREVQGRGEPALLDASE
ncbi:hypothetical protein BASA81_000329 [Batrachochytrium salamandrivorans]|nr:hypothetical protein BASA81_000329 [Batrachochytrium salamandrivorans]